MARSLKQHFFKFTYFSLQIYLNVYTIILFFNHVSVVNPLVPARTLKYVFYTLQPYSTVSFNTIFFKLTCTGSPVSQFSREKNLIVLSLLDDFWHIFKCKKVKKRPYTVKTLLKIKILLRHTILDKDVLESLTSQDILIKK